MKKLGLIVLSFVLAFSVFFPISVAAASNKYHISELGLEVTIPEGYSVVTRDTPASDPIFNALGTTKTAVINQFEASSIYLNAISNSAMEEIVVTMTENMIENFSLLSDTTLDILAATVVDQYSDYGIDVLDYEIYHHSQAKFIKIYFTDTAKTVYGLQYYTVYDGKAMNFTMRSYEGRLSSGQETAIKSTVDSILFDNAPPVVEEGEDTEPFQYTDTDTGVTFTVPANWQQKAFTEDREIIDAKFVSTKENGCAMIYGSADMWEAMSAIDRVGYTRSEINNAAFTKAEVAEIYGTTADEISTVTHNGVQYFIAEINTSSDVYDIDISMTMTQLVRIDNGWMYMFQFNGTQTHELYSDFVKLLSSVKYPAISNVEATEPSKPTTSVPDPSKENSSQNTSGNISQGSSSDSKDNTGVIVVLLVIVSAIVAAVVVIRKKNTETINQASHLTNNIDVPVGVGNGNDFSATSGWQCSCGRVHPAYETACVCGKSKFDNKLEQPQPDAAAEVTNKACFCRKCGEKLIDESRFCRMCGTQVVEGMTSPE